MYVEVPETNAESDALMAKLIAELKVRPLNARLQNAVDTMARFSVRFAQHQDGDDGQISLSFGRLILALEVVTKELDELEPRLARLKERN